MHCASLGLLFSLSDLHLKWIYGSFASLQASCKRAGHHRALGEESFGSSDERHYTEGTWHVHMGKPEEIQETPWAYNQLNTCPCHRAMCQIIKQSLTNAEGQKIWVLQWPGALILPKQGRCPNDGKGSQISYKSFKWRAHRLQNTSKWTERWLNFWTGNFW